MKDEKTRVILSAIKSYDELVFVYEKVKGDETKMLTRFVKPIELSEGSPETLASKPVEASVLCQQILPKSGFRRFKLSKIVSVFRVQTRATFGEVETKKADKPV